MPVVVRLTAKFKVEGQVDNEIFKMYREIVNQLVDYAVSKGIVSFKRLRSEKYYEMRAAYPSLPSHYVYTACQHACMMCNSYRRLRGRAKAGRPRLRKDAVLLDAQLFRLDMDRWILSLATPGGRVKLRVYHSDYHGKFRGWKQGQAWLVKKGAETYLHVSFSRAVRLRACRDVLGVDVNENNVTVASGKLFVRFETRERAIRTAYYLKRRRIQSRIRCRRARAKVFAKYRGRELNRVMDVYHKVAKSIVALALETGSAIAMENLKHIRRGVRFSRALNGRLNRWSFRKLQQTIEYKALEEGVPVVYVDPRGTSKKCPRCGSRMLRDNRRMLKCNCGLRMDRDLVGSWNIRLKGLKALGIGV